MGFAEGTYRQAVPKRILFRKYLNTVCSFGSSINVGFEET